MSTYTQILYQIVFSTKHRNRALIKKNREALFKDIWGILKNNKCHLYRVNGVEDHIHIITHIHPCVSPSSLVKDIKLGSSDYIKRNNLFPDFHGWQDGYAAFTYSIKEKQRLIEYVANQEEHHKAIFVFLLSNHTAFAQEKAETSDRMNPAMDDLPSDSIQIGFGIKPENEITSSVYRLNEKNFNRGSISDAENLFRGRISGLQVSRPGGNPNGFFTLK